MEMEPFCPQFVINSYLLREEGDKQFLFSKYLNNTEHFRANSRRRIILYADATAGSAGVHTEKFLFADV